MAELIAKTPCAGLLPLAVGGVELAEENPGALTMLSPYRGQEAALSAALESGHGAAFPAPNRSTGKAGARLVWFGRGKALLVGPEPDANLARLAALCDVSDAWAVVRLRGAGAIDVLARLVPLDLRPAAFGRGHTVRTELAHMMASITRLGADEFQIMAFRSMAATLVNELKTAMEAVAARG
ncbi:MAG: sarcosine oxidase subunit gamma [Jhaorihella sp.]